MHEAPPVEITAHLSLMGLLVFGAVGLGLLFVLAMILRAFTGRAHRAHHAEKAGAHVSHPRSALVPVLLGLGLLVVGVVLVGTLTVMPYQIAEPRGPVSARHEPGTGQPLPAFTAESSLFEAGFAAASDDSDSTSENPKRLPSWTKHEQTVLATGEVPRVLFVETSGLYSTQDEAMSEAMKNALGKFRSRLAETYSDLAVQPMPENIFRNASMQQVHVEKRMHSFGAYEEPMYRVYLQYGIGFGVLAALLGVVSAVLRAVSATAGSRGRAIMTALAFAGLGLVGLMFVA